MPDKIKEIYVGVTAEKDKDGNVVTGMLMCGGRPVPCDIYTPDHLPPRVPWDRLVAWAKRHDGHGLTIFYEGRENEQIKTAMKEHSAAADEGRRLQEAVAAEMAAGRTPDVEALKKKLSGVKTPKEVIGDARV